MRVATPDTAECKVGEGGSLDFLKLFNVEGCTVATRPVQRMIREEKKRSGGNIEVSQ